MLIRREAVERQSLLSLVTCSGKNARLVIPAQQATNTPVSIPFAAGQGKAGTGIGPAVADRVFEAEAAAAIEVTEVRLIGGDWLEFEVWEVLHGAAGVSLSRYDAQGNGPSPLSSPPKSPSPPPAKAAPANVSPGPATKRQPLRPNPHSWAGRQAAANSQNSAAANPSPAPTPRAAAPAKPVLSHSPSISSSTLQPQLVNMRQQAAVEQLKRLERRWKVTAALWVLFWIGAVIVIDSMIINTSADTLAVDPSNLDARFGYNLFNLFSCVLVDQGVLVPALICRAVVHRHRDRKRVALRKEASL